MSSASPQAVIDLGSHSALLLIGRLNKAGQLVPLRQEFAVTRLAGDLPATGSIREEAQERMRAVLEQFRHRIEKYNVARVQVVATEALRRAKNREEVAAGITELFGWPVKVLSPEEEGLYAYRGSLSDELLPEQKILIADVGGGSTELIIDRGRNIAQIASLPIGALNLAQKMDFKVRLGSGDRRELMQYLEQAFVKIPFWRRLDGQYMFIGSGGTAVTLAALQLKLTSYDYRRVNRCTIGRGELWRRFNMLNALSLAQRSRLDGMEAGREDVILYGTLIFLALMDLRALDIVHIRQGGVRFGWLHKMLSESK